MSDLDEKGLEAARAVFIEVYSDTDYRQAVAAAIRAYVAAMGEPVAPELLEALDLAQIGAPYRYYPGTGGIYMSLNADGYADADFKDWGLARSVAVILNHIQRIRSALAAPQPSHSRDGVAGIVQDAVVATAARAPGLRGPYVFDEAALQEQAAALSQAPAPEGWRDISTAPRDGTRFLAARNDGSVCEAYFLDNSHTRMPWAGVRPSNSMETVKPGVKFTHWQPLPTPPKEGQSHD